jgi:ketosteroid isomerase-like protein
MSRENVEVVRRVFEAFRAGLGRGDPGAAYDDTDVLAADAEWVAVRDLGAEVFRGRDGFIEFMRRWTEDFEDWDIQLDRLIDAGEDRVVAVFHQTAKGRASGVPVELNVAIVYDLERGRVVRMRNYLDLHEALEAAGQGE